MPLAMEFVLLRWSVWFLFLFFSFWMCFCVDDCVGGAGVGNGLCCVDVGVGDRCNGADGTARLWFTRAA